MTSRLGQLARQGLFLTLFAFAALSAPVIAFAAPYAAFVIDARTGEVLHARNADTRLHPASLTKMMTLYIAFQAIERGEISLDTMVTVTADAANEPPSKLGLRNGQQIRLRYLLRAAAVKSANDAATAIGIALSGSESAFAERMNRTAQAMGMSNTTFRNANGLTQSGHLSTARDMTTLGRHVVYDFPQYYNLFSRRTADAGIAQVANTNRRFLDSYPGADGIKTGFTQAAGFNLVASAQRGNQRIIATVFGGTSTANRNARVAELLDMGFSRAPSNAQVQAPTPPVVSNADIEDVVAVVTGNTDAAPAAGAGKTIRVTGQVATSMRPTARPATETAPALLAVDSDVIDSAVAEALQLATEETAPAAPAEAAVEVAAAASAAEPVPFQIVDNETLEVVQEANSDAEASEETVQMAALAPQARPAELVVAAAAAVAPNPTPIVTQPEVVTRVSTSGGRHWGINVGRFTSRYEAERVLLRVALNEMSTLDGSLRRVDQSSQGFDANFMGLTRETADLACRRLQARGTTCFMIGSEG